MAIYKVQNQWGGSSAPWNDGGIWVMGCRDNQNVVAVQAKSSDNGDNLVGTMTYAGEGPIGLKAARNVGNSYAAENQWGGNSAPWHDGGAWLVGCRDGQFVVGLDIKSADGGKTFEGTMTYAGEGPIGFKAELVDGSAYTTENQWGGSSAPWHPGGVMVLGRRNGQNPNGYDIKSGDGGKSFDGTMNYEGEGPIGFIGQRTGCWNTYDVQNTWGGSGEKHPAGDFVIGARNGQATVALNLSSSDGGKNLEGTMTYEGEGPIGFKGTLLA